MKTKFKLNDMVDMAPAKLLAISELERFTISFQQGGSLVKLVTEQESTSLSVGTISLHYSGEAHDTCPRGYLLYQIEEHKKYAEFLEPLLKKTYEIRHSQVENECDIERDLQFAPRNATLAKTELIKLFSAINCWKKMETLYGSMQRSMKEWLIRCEGRLNIM